MALATLLGSVGEVADVQMKKLEQSGLPASQWPPGGFVALPPRALLVFLIAISVFSLAVHLQLSRNL
jgi:hypothetical protein